MGIKKVELLAPAGNFDGLKGAIKAGADAVYLGGECYSARAYAENFTEEEICMGIRLAHIFGRKVYLTVNTLIKEKELDRLYDFLLPFYECGLDGVIVQDFGVLCYIRSHFPGLPLHASTQMTITGNRGARLVKEIGISRIVPARELSLEEVKKIKTEAEVEIEAFIHGAMCYCYSGQCLFSSLLGGRSGNRGRCAQPCRLPYEVNGCRCYPLSMRDMCTLEILPMLIESGIDSFKIEGRMKKAAYAAGVTAIYRKYIDLYYQYKENYHVSKEDRKALENLYIRSSIGDGYYRRANGREMITLNSPAYTKTDENQLREIEKKYIEGNLSREVSADICLKAGEPAKITLRKDGICAACTGELVQKAKNQPLTKEGIEEKIQKCGNSFVKITQVNVDADDNIFMSVHSLNELRRNASVLMEDEIIRQEGFSWGKKRAALPPCPEKKQPVPEKYSAGKRLHVSVRTKGQLWAAMKEQAGRIYVDYSLLNSENMKELLKYKENYQEKRELYVAVPYIVREKDIVQLEKIDQAFSSGIFDGVLVRNLESCQFFIEKNAHKIQVRRKIALDSNFYLWNRESLGFWQNWADEFFLPLELNAHEWNELLAKDHSKDLTVSAVVYGRLPVMVTANCLKKTMTKCNRLPEKVMLKDRYKKQFPVYTDCLCCYNVIYNSVPLSLHKMFAAPGCMDGNFRLDFTFEEDDETAELIQYFQEILFKYREPFYKEYTTGHYKRGVE